MPETAENGRGIGISRQDQDAFALRSPAACCARTAAGFFAEEIVAVRNSWNKDRARCGG